MQKKRGGEIHGVYDMHIKVKLLQIKQEFSLVGLIAHISARISAVNKFMAIGNRILILRLFGLISVDVLKWVRVNTPTFQG